LNTRSVLHLIAYMLIVLAIAVAICWGIARYYDDPLSAQHGLIYSGLIMLVVGAALALATRGTINLSRRDGFGVVAFGWLAASIFGAMPYILSGVIPHPVSAIFETMSGFTTTGASVLSNLESVPRGILFWRALTHLIGGMGVLVLCVAILPFLGVGGMQLYRAEMPGPSKDRLTPRITSTAKLLWGVYMLLCVMEIILLRFGHMSWFDATCHAFATMATGGFSTRSASVAAFDSTYIDVVIIVFMFLAGANFSLHYRALRGQPSSYFKDPEFRFYFFTWLTGGLFLTFDTWHSIFDSFGLALRAGFFQATSILTTTGFVTQDFDTWSDSSRILLVLLMFIGGCAGSTGGAIKNIRIFILLKQTAREIRQFMRPKAVLQVKLNGEPVDTEAVSNIMAFVAMFVLIFAVGTFAMTFFVPDVETAFSSVIASLGNIGPGLAGVGATKTYADIPAVGKGILTLCMLLGRLELYTVLVILLPSFWKK